MRFLDLSQLVFENSPNCPLDPPPVVRVENDGDWQIESLAFTSHTGSHLDAPRHRIPRAATIDEISLDRFAGAAWLLDLRENGAPLVPDAEIGSAHLQRGFEGREISDHIILLCTGWGELRARSDAWLFHPPFLAPDGARFLAENKVRGVGIDCYSIGGANEPANGETHEILLSRGIWACEELRFPDEVWNVAQPAQFLALPIHLRGASGAPCRPVLVI